MLGNKNTVKTFKLTVFAKKNQIAVSFQGLLSPNRQEAFLIFTRIAIFVEQKKIHKFAVLNVSPIQQMFYFG